MANLLYLNNVPPAATASAAAFMDLINRLIAVGWKVMGSSDQTSFNNSLTSSPVGTNFCNDFAAGTGATRGPWLRLRMPTGTSELLFIKANDGQGSTDRRNYRIKYSRLGLFVDGPRTNGVISGSVSALNPPSASDERVIVGGGSPFSGIANDDLSNNQGENVFVGTGGASAPFFYHLLVQDAAPWGFWLIAYYPLYANSNNKVVTAIVCDPLTGCDPTDADPYAFYASNIGGNTTPQVFAADSMLVGVANGPVASIRAGLSREAWVRAWTPGMYCFSTATASAQLVYPRNCGGNLYGGAEDSDPLMYLGGNYPQGTAGGVTGFKGFSTLFWWKQSAWATHTTLKSAVNNDRIVFDDVLTYWDPTKTPRLS